MAIRGNRNFITATGAIAIPVVTGIIIIDLALLYLNIQRIKRGK